jgi:hypothetical protein
MVGQSGGRELEQKEINGDGVKFGEGQGDKHNDVGAEKTGSFIADNSCVQCMVVSLQRPLACVSRVAKQQTDVSLGIPIVLRILNFDLYRIRHEVCLQRVRQLRLHLELVFWKINGKKAKSFYCTHSETN